MQHPINWILVMVGAILILLEILLGGVGVFDLILLGCAILLGGIAGILSGTPIVGGGVAAVLTILYATVGRRRIHRRRAEAHVPFRRR